MASTIKDSTANIPVAAHYGSESTKANLEQYSSSQLGFQSTNFVFFDNSLVRVAVWLVGGWVGFKCLGFILEVVRQFLTLLASPLHAQPTPEPTGSSYFAIHCSRQPGTVESQISEEYLGFMEAKCCFQHKNGI